MPLAGLLRTPAAPPAAVGWPSSSDAISGRLLLWRGRRGGGVWRTRSSSPLGRQPGLYAPCVPTTIELVYVAALARRVDALDLSPALREVGALEGKQREGVVNVDARARVAACATPAHRAGSPNALVRHGRRAPTGACGRLEKADARVPQRPASAHVRAMWIRRQTRAARTCAACGARRGVEFAAQAAADVADLDVVAPLGALTRGGRRCARVLCSMRESSSSARS